MNISLVLTNARINGGYPNEPAIVFNEQGTFARFRASVPKYDSTAKANKWINVPVRLLGKKIVERLQKCNLGEGSYINLTLELDSSEYTKKDGTKVSEVAFNVVDFDLPRVAKPVEAQQMPVQNGYQMQQGQQYAGQPMGQMPVQGGYQAQGAQQTMPTQTVPVQQAAPVQPTGTFTVLPDAPQQPAQQPNAFVAPVNGGFTGFEAAGQAMGIPNDGSAFMGGFGEG